MTTPPEAEVLAVRGRQATIRCPYCHREHAHEIGRHGTQRFAPGCGMYRSPHDRARGYRFTTSRA